MDNLYGFIFLLPMFVFGIGFFIAEIHDKRVLAKKQEAEALEEYKEYATASLVAKIWSDYSKVGVCGKCGMDDEPVITFHSGSTKCKWCAECDNITYHLQHNGVRRLRAA